MAKKKKDKTIKIDASFEQLVKESVSGNPKPEPKKVTEQDRVKAALKLAGIVKKENEAAKKGK